MTNLPNNTPSEQPASQQASPSRQSLESEVETIIVEYKDMSERGLSDHGLKQALLKTVDRYVEEEVAKRPMFFPRAMGKTAYFTDIFIKECKNGKTAEYHHPDYVVMSRKQYDKIQKKLTSKALRQQVKGGEG